MKRTQRRLAAAAALTLSLAAVIATWPQAANADAPVQAGWWNAASGGGSAAPAPTTPEGGLRVATAPGQTLAFGAVSYVMPTDATATLELKVAGSPQGTPTIQACPTKDTSWKAGDNQSWDAAPEYDCTLRSYVGSFAADNTAVTFLVDSSAETVPGQLSLALVPVTTAAAPGVGTEVPADTTPPFAVDFNKPDAGSLIITSSSAPLPAYNGGSGSSGTTTSGSGSTSSGAGATTTSSDTGGAGVVPPSSGGALPDAGSAVTPGDSAPVVAPTQAATTAGTPAPVAAAAPSSSRAHDAALALLLLIGIGVVAMSSGSMQRAPRLLGGAARHAAPYPAEGGPDGVVVPPGMQLVSAYGTRGLGRFVKPRSEPPRPLV